GTCEKFRCLTRCRNRLRGAWLASGGSRDRRVAHLKKILSSDDHRRVRRERRWKRKRTQYRGLFDRASPRRMRWSAGKIWRARNGGRGEFARRKSAEIS